MVTTAIVGSLTSLEGAIVCSTCRSLSRLGLVPVQGWVWPVLREAAEGVTRKSPLTRGTRPNLWGLVMAILFGILPGTTFALSRCAPELVDFALRPMLPALASYFQAGLLSWTIRRCSLGFVVAGSAAQWRADVQCWCCCFWYQRSPACWYVPRGGRGRCGHWTWLLLWCNGL